MARRGFSTEFSVGAFALGCVALIAFGWWFFSDGLRKGEDAYRVTVVVPSADGLYAGTPVRIAGVDVGSIESIAVDGNRARLGLAIRTIYPVPADTRAEIRSAGMLGDRYIALDLGASDALLDEGARLDLGREPGDIDAITRQVEAVSDDVQAITSVLREMLEDDRNVDHAEATLANVDAISAELRLMAEANRRDVDQIVDSVKRLTENLAAFSDDATVDLGEEIDALRAATDELDGSLKDVRSITTKIDQGQGTLGALVNDRATIDAINDTVDNANSVIESFSGMHAEVYYLGRVFVGSQPDDPQFFYGNPAAPADPGDALGWAGSNNIGIELRSQEDFGWIFEVNDYPQGAIKATEHYFPDTGVHYTEWERGLDYRLTFQMTKRWWDLGFRLGIKENGGGVGLTWFLLQDRLMLNADVFDFTFGPYPALESMGLPNLRAGARIEPLHHLWLETGGEQILLGARYGYATGYVGAGFHFSDDDIKLLFATLPLGL
jgi:phospholipid/cholesterol/gamma-HCH transport system substrate-binding protein